MEHKGYVDGYLKKVRENVKEPNKSLMLDFTAQMRAEGLSESRILAYISNLYRMEAMLGKPFRKAEKRDIVRVVNGLTDIDTKTRYHGKVAVQSAGKLADCTITGYKIALKKFYKWIDGGDDYPEPVRWLKCTSRKLSGFKAEDLLSPEEVAAMISHTRNIRDRALIGLTYETGARSGEIWQLKRKDIEFTPDGAVIHVTNEKYHKGEKRSVPVVYCVRDVMAYMGSMNDQGPDAYLWQGLQGSKAKGRIDKSSYLGIFKRAAVGAGIEKRVWAHGLRHVRVSHVKDKLTEQVQKEIFGWSPRSEMVGHYGRLSKDQSINAVFSGVYGITKADGDKGTACPRCAAVMPFEAAKCWRCGQVLKEEVIIEERNLRKELDEMKEAMRQTQEYQEHMKEMLEKMGMRKGG